MTQANYEAAWRALSEPLAWMHDNPRLKRYWGWNLADIANDLIDQAYPGLRTATQPAPDAAVPAGRVNTAGWHVNSQTPSVIMTPHGRISIGWSEQAKGCANDYSLAEDAARVIVDAIAAAAPKVASDTVSDQCRPTLRQVMSGGEPRAWDSDDERRGWYAGYDAAVDEAKRKVASEGAGLREAVDPELVERVRYAVNHPEAKGFALAKAGMTRHDFRRILAAPATDATDGATGGGDVLAWRSFADGSCPLCQAREYHAPECPNAPWNTATTTGADLLEQAARAIETWEDWGEWYGLDRNNRVAQDTCTEAAKRIRALSARNLTDGGEA